MTPLLRVMRPEDLPEVAEVQRLNPAASQWDPADYLLQESWVAEETGRVVAFLVLRQVAPDSIEVLNLAVHPAWQRRGLATSLLKEKAFDRECTLFLEVRESNEAAVRLYRRLGFTEAGRRPGYYRCPDEAAIVMKLQK